jgi:hypothetical protein
MGGLVRRQRAGIYGKVVGIESREIQNIIKILSGNGAYNLLSFVSWMV